MKNLSLIALILALTACGETPKDNANSNATANTSASSPSVTAENKADLVKVDAKTIYQAYKDNEVNSDSKYKDKNLEVTGTVDSIESGMGDEANVMLKTGDEIIRVNATMADSEKAKVGELKKGAKVKLHCVGGGEVIGMPMLKDCKFA